MFQSPMQSWVVAPCSLSKSILLVRGDHCIGDWPCSGVYQPMLERERESMFDRKNYILGKLGKDNIDRCKDCIYLEAWPFAVFGKLKKQKLNILWHLQQTKTILYSVAHQPFIYSQFSIDRCIISNSFLRIIHFNWVSNFWILGE